jgi:hypothetical protein
VANLLRNRRQGSMTDARLLAFLKEVCALVMGGRGVGLEMKMRWRMVMVVVKVMVVVMVWLWLWWLCLCLCLWFEVGLWSDDVEPAPAQAVTPLSLVDFSPV